MTMNDRTPLTADQIDELISADLDGEFDAAARDFGLDPADARAQLDAASGVASRRDAMAAARAHLADVPPVEELLAARLRAKAVREAESNNAGAHARRGRSFAALSAVAAALVLVAGIAFAIKQSGTTKSSNKSSGAAVVEAPRVPGQLYGVALGAFSDTRALAESAFAAARASDAATRAPAPTAENGRRSDSPENGGNASPPTSAAACASTATRLAGPSAQPVLYAGAVLAGRAVEVFVYRNGGDEIVIVTAPAPGCSFVSQQVTPARAH